MPDETAAVERLVLEGERRRITGVGKSTWWALEAKGLAPRRRIVVGRKVGWLESELVAWVHARPVGAPPVPKAAMAARGLGSKDAA